MRLSSDIRPTRTPILPKMFPIPPMCALCSGCTTSGSWLAAGRVSDAQTLWVCVDCQHKLARGVDDDGALGG